MKLLIVTQKIDYNDPVLGFFHRWVEEFAKSADSVVLLASFVGAHSLPANVSVYSFGKEKGRKKLLRIWNFWGLFSRHFADADAVFFHMIPEFVIAASPFLVSRKCSTGLWYAHKSVTPKLRFAEKFVTFIFTSSHDGFRTPSKKVIAVGQAIDTDFFSVSSLVNHAPGIRLLTAGRISPVKDIETIIRACGILKETWTREWVLLVVGGPAVPRDYVYFESLKALVGRLGLAHAVHFAGAHPYLEMPELYRAHDIFISLSSTGSMDKAVLEAMASGLSVLTANESFQSTLPAKYFLEKRSPELLAERIKVFADEQRPNRELRRLVVERHGLTPTIQRIIEVLKTVHDRTR